MPTTDKVISTVLKEESTISKLVDEATQQWNVDLLELVFLPCKAKEIKKSSAEHRSTC